MNEIRRNSTAKNKLIRWTKMFSQSLQPLPPGLDKTRETLHPRPAHNLHRCSPFYVTISGHHGSTASPKLSLPSHRNAFVKNVENFFCVVHEERKRKEARIGELFEGEPDSALRVSTPAKKGLVSRAPKAAEKARSRRSSSQSLGKLLPHIELSFQLFNNC